MNIRVHLETKVSLFLNETSTFRMEVYPILKFEKKGL